MSLPFLIVSTFLLAASVAAAAQASARWNVLFVLSDALNTNLGCDGHPQVTSPNLDRLAARGMRFDRAYSHYPVRNPSRTSFPRGRRPDTTGVVDNNTPTRAHRPDAIFLPAFFRRQGRPRPNDHLAKVPDHALTYRTGSNPRFPRDRPGDATAAYYAVVRAMDAQEGGLRQALDHLRLWDRTIVVFQSDHGYHLGEHGGLWHKLSLFEACTRIPLILATPGRKPGASWRLVEAVDLYLTLADLCGLPTQAEPEGTSFKPLRENPARPWKEAAFTVVSRPRQKGEAKLGDMQMLGRTSMTDAGGSRNGSMAAPSCTTIIMIPSSTRTSRPSPGSARNGRR